MGQRESRLDFGHFGQTLVSLQERRRTLIYSKGMEDWTMAMLGDPGVGKTALANQFTMNVSVDCTETSVDDYRRLLLVDNRQCIIGVVTTANLDHWATLRETWLRQDQGFILVYSISDRATFDRINHWREMINGDPAAFILIGNKADQDYARKVTKSEGEALATELGCHFLETSAKTAQNVDRLFETMVRLLRDAAGSRVAAAEHHRARKRTKCCVL
ncbi:ras protein [Roridomyces roridus]|uniref:Ras protein n=1 Tax=Roridomyces roridus TaxID=1738132 RepID=A0AAD7FR27_9AGAR|nr:ras protein [Roridomyces roridus]